MVATIFKLGSPYLQRYLAKQVADFLQRRREQRLAINKDEEKLLECPPCPPSMFQQDNLLSNKIVWFTASGVLLGSALGFGLAQIMNRGK